MDEPFGALTDHARPHGPSCCRSGQHAARRSSLDPEAILLRSGRGDEPRPGRVLRIVTRRPGPHGVRACASPAFYRTNELRRLLGGEERSRAADGPPTTGEASIWQARRGSRRAPQPVGLGFTSRRMCLGRGVRAAARHQRPGRERCPIRRGHRDLPDPARSVVLGDRVAGFVGLLLGGMFGV
jgi:hypothetical protein